jgi:glucosamine 6-phosphate synthetase-like amidotransferase/phosphosugar isomerase protein
MSNYLDSPMALSADLAVPISAGEEATVSTKTYINMLAILSLTSSQLAGGDWQSLRTSMRRLPLWKITLPAQAESITGCMRRNGQLLIKVAAPRWLPCGMDR